MCSTVCWSWRIRLNAARCCRKLDMCLWWRCLLSWLLRCWTQSVSAWGRTFPCVEKRTREKDTKHLNDTMRMSKWHLWAWSEVNQSRRNHNVLKPMEAYQSNVPCVHACMRACVTNCLWLLVTPAIVCALLQVTLTSGITFLCKNTIFVFYVHVSPQWDQFAPPSFMSCMSVQCQVFLPPFINTVTPIIF